MDSERVEQELRELQQWLDDPPPLLTLVVLANGRGLAYPYPLFDDAGVGPLEHRIAALSVVRAFMVEFVARLDTQLLAINRTLAIYRDERGEELEREKGDD
jgi:hypothetical protein